MGASEKSSENRSKFEEARRKRGKASSVARCLLAIALVAGLSVPLSGCKDTDVLTEVTIDQDKGWVDYNLTPVWKNVENAQADSTKISAEQQQTDNIDEQENDQPTYDEDNPNTPDTQTDQREYHQDTDKQYEATDGDQASESRNGDAAGGSTAGGLANLFNAQPSKGSSDKGNGGSKKSDTTLNPDKNADADDNAPTANGTTKDDGQSTQPGNGNSIGGDSGQGQGGPGQSYDANGTVQSLPHGLIAAAGQYATITQMLGGKGSLTAADSAWLSQVNASAAFPNEGVENIVTGWTGTSADVDAIVRSGAKVVLLEKNSQYLTNAQVQQLIDQGVSVVHVPKLGDVDTPDEDVVKAVQVVAEILNPSTNGGSSSMAATYISYRSQALKACESANGVNGLAYKVSNGTAYNSIYQNGGYGTSSGVAQRNTAFIDSWTSVNVDSFLGSQSYNSAKDFYLEGKTVDGTDGVGLSAAASTDDRERDCALLDYYLQYAGVADQSLDSINLFRNPYVVGLAVWGTEVQDATAVPTTAHFMFSHGLWYHTTGTPDNSANYDYVGSESFPACIARNEDIADRVVMSAAKTNGFYNAGRAYRVYVMPSGLAGNWADGTVESYLAAPWANCMFLQGKDLSACTTYIDQFYSTFYRCSYQDAYDTGLLSGYGVVKTAGSQWL